MTALRPLRLLTLGDLLLDVLVQGDFSREYDSAGTVQLYPGGSAANFAAGAAGLGAEVRFVCQVGDDATGKLLVQDLRDQGVRVSARVVPDLPSGTVLVLRHVEGPGSSRMWSNPGASRTLAAADLDPAWFADLDGMHMTGYTLLRPEPRPAGLRACTLLRAHSPTAFFSLDPNPAHLLADAGPDWFRAVVRDLHPDLLLPNREEGRLLAGADDPLTIVARLLTLAPLVALKLGADGCLVGWDTECRHLPAQAGLVVDATGAGDAFAAGFVTTYLTERDPLLAAEAATRCAAAVVGRAGAR